MSVIYLFKLWVFSTLKYAVDFGIDVNYYFNFINFAVTSLFEFTVQCLFAIRIPRAIAGIRSTGVDRGAGY